MVRVISVHHFTGQHVQTIEQPTACTTVPPNKLLLALTNNSIEVRDLNNESDIIFTFPTVDEVVQLIYSRNGDYIGTLETKSNRYKQQHQQNFVRIYINWNTIVTLQQSKMTNNGVSLQTTECGMVQPMRARIAGRVTPTINQSELGNLEMIEIPINSHQDHQHHHHHHHQDHSPQQIQCCPISGNLLILTKRNCLYFYQFCVKTHDISKIKFIDFEQLTISIQLPFQSKQIEFNENYIAAMNDENMYLFKINNNHNNDNNNNNNNTKEYEFHKFDDTIDYQQLLNDDSSNLTINLPTIKRDNSLIHKHSPFTINDKEMCAQIVYNNNNINNHHHHHHHHNNYDIVNLIQLKLIPIIVESPHRQITEEFKCFTMKPLYIDDNLINFHGGGSNVQMLSSDYRKSLGGIVCMVATQQEGYLYYFDEIHNTNNVGDDDNCIGIYPFTSPIQQLVMEDYFLHALTETGLESYTLRYGHKLFNNLELCDNINITCPSIDDPICLIGLRPFLNIEQLLLNDHNLILLANSNDDTSPTHSIGSNNSSNTSYWTLYNLELPNPKTVFNDITIVANVHRFTSIQTYCHLLSEAHIILRLTLLLKKWINIDDNVKLIISQCERKNIDDIIELYRTSCALLGDHYIMCQHDDDYKLAIPYYKMARISPIQVVRRVKKIQEQSNNHSTKGLLNYLKTILMEIRNNRDLDKFFGKQQSSNKQQNFIDILLEIIDDNDLPELILKSCILREYSIDKLINLLLTKSNNNNNNNEKYLSLSILYLQKSYNKKSLEYLLKIRKDELIELLINNWELLFDTTHIHQQNSNNNKSKITMNFNEFSCLLMNTYPNEFTLIIIKLILDENKLNLNKLIKMFIDFIPTSIGNDNNLHINQLLQQTLELYFTNYLNKYGHDLNKLLYERGINDAIKLLIRSYLSQLQLLQIKDENKDHKQQQQQQLENVLETNDDNHKTTAYFVDEQMKVSPPSYLFESYRYQYLDKMPPFQIEITSKLYEICVADYVQKSDDCYYRNNEEADFLLKKLQAILCTTPVVTKQIVNEVDTFLLLNDNLRGNYSLRSIITTNLNDAITLLIDKCPQCLLQFIKDRLLTNCNVDEWKFAIVSLQRHILNLCYDDNLKRICFFYKKILKDVLTYAATTMTLDQLLQIFPQRFNITSVSNNANNCGGGGGGGVNDLDLLNDIQNYEPYIVICKETMHANQINKLITTTGQQLLCTLNL